MAVVGEAFVEISPLTGTFGAKTEAAVKAALAGFEPRVEVEVDFDLDLLGLREKIELATAGLRTSVDVDLNVRGGGSAAAPSSVGRSSALGDDERLEKVKVKVDRLDDNQTKREIEGSLRRIGQITKEIQLDVDDGGVGEKIRRATSGAGAPPTGGIRTLLAGLALPALDAAVGGLAALSGGMLGASSAAFSLAGALGSTASAALTLPSAFGAAAQGALTLGSAFGGIGGALKAHTAAQKAATVASVGGGAAAVDQAKAVEAAERAIRSANRALTDAYEDAAYSAEQSNRRQADAQDELTQARSRARDEVEDLRRSVERLALSEEQAAARVAELRAKKALAEKRAAQDLTGVTESTLRALERQAALEDKAAENPRLQADLDLRDAELDLKETIEQRTEAQTKLTQAEAVGVDGSADVVAAMQAISDASRDAERSRVQSARRIEAAEDSVAVATDRLTDALTASTAGVGAAAGAVDAYEAALAGLAPAQRRFVEFLVSLKPIFDDLRDATSEALLPGLETSIRNVLPLMDDFKPILVDTATALSDIAIEASLLVSSPAWRTDLVRIGKGNVEILRTFGAFGLSAADAARTLAADVQPLTLRLSEMTARIAELASQTLEAKSASGELSEFFDRVGDRIENVTLVAGFLGSALLDVFKAATPVGDEYLNSLVRLSARLDLIVERARDSGAPAGFLRGSQARGG